MLLKFCQKIGKKLKTNTYRVANMIRSRLFYVNTKTLTARPHHHDVDSSMQGLLELIFISQIVKRYYNSSRNTTDASTSS